MKYLILYLKEFNHGVLQYLKIKQFWSKCDLCGVHRETYFVFTLHKILVSSL